MTLEQIQSIVAAGAYPGGAQPAEWLETHISWVILTTEFAFKIKKPVVLGFLDFGTVAKRQFFCQEELRLNRRLAPDLYLDVLPIGMKHGQLAIGADIPDPLDYAVQMRRMDNRLQMDHLLAENRVGIPHLEQLADVLAAFHLQVRMTGPIVYHPGAHWADFAELYRFGADLEQHAGHAARQTLQQWRRALPDFLERHAPRLIERVRSGFWVDGHGDLHTRNIFLPGQTPVVFDCIEFDPHFRQNDILNELAFLCMDLDVQGRPDLAAAFLHAYGKHWNIFPKPEDRALFLFFKAYRANVRLKVALLELRQHAPATVKNQAQRYWQCLERYVAELLA